MKFRYIRFLLIVVALLGVATFALTYANAWHEKSEAVRFLAVLSTVKVGSTTESEVLNATKPFNHYEDSAGKPDRQGRQTGLAYTFSNRPMAFLHLAPAKFVYAGMEFRDGIVSKKSVNFYQEPRFGIVVQEVVAPGEGALSNSNARQLRTNVYGPQLVVIDVYDDTSVPLSRRQRDWQIDLSCMTAIRSCRNPQGMLPGIYPQKS